VGLVENHLKLQFSEESNRPIGEWDPTRWIYRETTKDDFIQGTLNNLIAKLPGSLTFPDQYGWCFGPATIGDIHEITQDHFYPYSERLWVVWKNNSGQMWRAKSNAEFTDWEEVTQILFIPSGATHPTICFDENGNYVLAVDLIQPGLTDTEVWLLEYPYNGNYIRKICNGERPKLFMDNQKDVLFFYHDDLSLSGNTQIRYRAKSQSYNTENTVPVGIGGVKTVHAIRFFYYGPETKPDYYLAALLFYKVSTEGLTRYIKTKVLEERPIVVIPEQGQTAFSDSYHLTAAVTGITWDEIKLVTQSFTDVYAVQGIVAGISWTELKFETIQLIDSYAISVVVNALEWRSISFKTESITDTYSLTGGVRSILWIQV
jgi:hypothetical protein